MITENSESRVGPFGRYITFSGLGMAFMATIACLFKPLEKMMGEKLLPYAIVAMAMAIIFATLYLYNRCPKKLVMPLGVVGWILSFFILFFQAFA